MNSDIIYIGYENLEKIVKFLELQIREESDVMRNINDSYNNLNGKYISDNTNMLKQICDDIIINMKKNKNNHDSNVFLIEKRIQNVKEKIQEVKEIDDSAQFGGVVNE